MSKIKVVVWTHKQVRYETDVCDSLEFRFDKELDKAIELVRAKLDLLTPDCCCFVLLDVGDNHQQTLVGHYYVSNDSLCPISSDTYRLYVRHHRMSLGLD